MSAGNGLKIDVTVTVRPFTDAAVDRLRHEPRRLDVTFWVRLDLEHGPGLRSFPARGSRVRVRAREVTMSCVRSTAGSACPLAAARSSALPPRRRSKRSHRDAALLCARVPAGVCST